MRKMTAVCLLLSLASCSAISKIAHNSSETPLEKLNWKLGAQAYTFRALSLFETIDVLKRLDLHYIEMYPGQRFSKENPAKADHNMSDPMIAELKSKLAENNVQAMSYGVVGLSKDEAENRKVFQFASRMGIKTIVSEPNEDALPLIDKMCKEFSMNMAIHDHPKPSLYWNCETTAKAVAPFSKRIGACADIGHWKRSGMVPAECIKMLQGRIIELHMKDIDDKKEDVVWGTGTVDVAACLKELKRQNAGRLLFSIEYEKGSGEELITNVSKSIQFFKDQAATLVEEK
jgi:sugar phosphate isomerase/epimerase